VFARHDRVYGRAFDEDEELLCVCEAAGAREVGVCVTMEDVSSGADAEFIAHARVDLPTALSEIARLEAALRIIARAEISSKRGEARLGAYAREILGSPS
jgi:hypothetical protein